jgi:hypothetical protein
MGVTYDKTTTPWIPLYVMANPHDLDLSILPGE